MTRHGRPWIAALLLFLLLAPAASAYAQAAPPPAPAASPEAATPPEAPPSAGPPSAQPAPPETPPALPPDAAAADAAAPSAAPAYADIRALPYAEGYLPLMKASCRDNARAVIAMNPDRLAKVLTDAEVNGALMQFLPSTDTVEVIVDKAVLHLRRKFSNEFKWFDRDKLNVLVAGIILLLCIGWYTWRASQGEELFIRRIAGLQSIDEAVGRCTEMGKPVLYIPGIYDMDDIQTISSMSILSHIARKTAEYETPLLVPCTRSLVMSTAYEVTKEAYIQAGKADSFQGDNIRYLTDDQFGYVAGVDGIMMRDKPAANFYLGVFFAESLILAETGHSIGSIQVAGTASVHQIPFFVAACDYTLIGEELFAASAYLSRDPMQLGSIKGQDMTKFIMMIVLFVGIVVASVGEGGKELVELALKAR